ncbi:hypothetical protein BC832DRAFT_114900 [Gaertneriomyces semiglobifer]|nr:hypothetical protein BC832DRAFT_114900 [Gaertneriomyces semiglobifer]
MTDRTAKLKSKPSGSGRASRRPSMGSLSKINLSSKSEAVAKEEGSPADHATGDLVLTVKVIGAKGIKGAKGDRVSSFVRVQFADFDYKESSVVTDNANPQFEYLHEQAFHIDEALIDTFANDRLHITLIESLPKEKTAVLGEGELRLFSPFLKYQPRDPNNPDEIPPPPPLSFRTTVPINYVNPRLLGKDDDPNRAVPELDVEVSLSKHLIPPETVDNGTFMTFKVDDFLPVPDEWTLKEGNEKDINSNMYIYTLNFSMPAETTTDRLISIRGGTLVTSDAPVLTDPTLTAPQPIMLPKPGTAFQGAVAGGLNDEVKTSGLSAEGETQPIVAIPSTPERVERVIAGENVKKISWSRQHLVWLPTEALVRLRERVRAKQPLEMEFTRELQPRFGHVVDTLLSRYRARVTIDLSSLLFPRVMGMKGRWPAEGYDSPGSQPSDGMTALHARNTAVASSTMTLDSQQAQTKKGKAYDPHLYKNLGTTLGLEFVVERPLLDKKKLQPITKSVTDFIPRRVMPAQMIFEKRSKRADSNYAAQLQEIVKRLVKEYEGIFAGEEDSKGAVVSTDATGEQQRRKRFFFHLNKSGTYFSLKEQLKTSVVEIVRERFRHKTPFASKQELQLFMSEVYVYLVDKMHEQINNIIQHKESAFTDAHVQTAADFATMKQHADDAEQDMLPELAASYHQQRIAKFEDSTQAWFDYACFALRNNMAAKGEECLRQILSTNPKHIPSLLAYGAFCCIYERFEEARVYLVTAVELQPRYILGLTLLGLYYDVIGEEEESENLITEATRLQKATLPPDASSIYMSLAEFLIHVHAGQLAERALSQEILNTQPRVAPYLLLSKLELQRSNFKLAEEHLSDALKIHQDEPNVWASIGHLQYIRQQWEQAQMSYETVLSLSQEPINIALVYVRLGTIYLNKANADGRLDGNMARMAKSMFLRASSVSPTSASWLGVGRACLVMHNYDEAEDALAEANVLNNRHADVWAYLALLNLKLNRQFEANQCIGQALRLGVKNAGVLSVVGQEFLQKDDRRAASECLRMCLEIDPTNSSFREAFAQAVDSSASERQSVLRL